MLEFKSFEHKYWTQGDAWTFKVAFDTDIENEEELLDTIPSYYRAELDRPGVAVVSVAKSRVFKPDSCDDEIDNEPDYMNVFQTWSCEDNDFPCFLCDEQSGDYEVAAVLFDYSVTYPKWITLKNRTRYETLKSIIKTEILEEMPLDHELALVMDEDPRNSQNKHKCNGQIMSYCYQGNVVLVAQKYVPKAGFVPTSVTKDQLVKFMKRHCPYHVFLYAKSQKKI